MLFFKSKKEKNKAAEDAANDAQTVISEEPSLFDVDKLLSASGYKIYTHDQGRKQVEKSLKNNLK